jgi:hypothetical protein
MGCASVSAMSTPGAVPTQEAVKPVTDPSVYVEFVQRFAADMIRARGSSTALESIHANDG